MFLRAKLRLSRSISNSLKSCRNIISVSGPNDRGIATVTLQNPPVNSLTKQLFDKLDESIQALENDPKCEALLLTSSCRVFSAGLDLNVFHNPDTEELREFWRSFQRLQRRLYTTPLYTLAGLNGHTIAAGCILALCCDERILSNGSKIGLNEVTFGLLPPPFASHLMIKTIGYRQGSKALNLGTLFHADHVYETPCNPNNLPSPPSPPSPPSSLQDFITYCYHYITQQLTLPGSKSSNSLIIPGRRQQKAVLTRESDMEYYGNTHKLEYDVDLFIQNVTDPVTQQRIQIYLDSLSSTKKKPHTSS